MRDAFPRLAAIWVALLLLLALTAGSSRFDLGIGNIAINLAISLAKTVLIGAVFMHLLHGTALLRLASAATVSWLMILYLLTMADYATR